MKQTFLKFALIFGFGFLFLTIAHSTHSASVAAANSETQSVYLPVVLNAYCSFDFCDSFNDPTSGWPIVDNANYALNYINGTYQMRIKQPVIALAGAPYTSVTDFFIETNARWTTAGGAQTDGLYGLIFGANSTLENYYTFYVWLDHPDFGTAYTLRRVDSGVVTILINWTESDELLKGTNTNRLAVTKQGDAIDLIINGIVVDTYDQPTFSSPGFVGLLTVNLDTADARFADYVIQNFDTTTAGDSEAIGISAESTTTINAADLFD
ncbi:MAG: hypothetical protein M9941_11730 [Anaerolineae bacterium]|nr:hypothetical protein [Anaerolineae bacterium]